ncbi:MAG: response regulator [Candidatus Hydrogenedentes bacterium]|nr:response regulator [Candidatus Hydrogenedentota bacterium]
MSTNVTKTILVVDDEQEFREEEREFLEAEGYSVVEAEGRVHAHELLNQHHYDMALVDLMMEEADSGFVLAREIKRAHPEMPVIIITGVATEMGIEFDVSSEEERRWIKADALLAKPIRFEQLTREMNRLLHE